MINRYNSCYYNPETRMLLHPSSQAKAFTFVEVCIALVVCLLFGAAAFATNQRLLYSIKSQRESTAATMMLQERMETFRGTAYSDIADKDFVKNSILTFNPAASPAPTPSDPPGGPYTTWSEGPLGGLQETVTVSGYLAASPAPYATPAGTPFYNQWTRDTVSGDHHPHEANHYDHLVDMYDLLKVDISITWTSANGRTRSRDLSAVVGKGNVGQ